MQLLRSLLKQISYESVRGDDDRVITDICCHSEKVKEDSLFVCINGYRNNGHEYLPQAVERGAAVLVVDDGYVIESRSGPVILTEHMKVNVTELIHERHICVVTVRDTRKALSTLSAAFFDHPAEKMKMIGITGTNGKTTTAFLVAGILREAGYRVGMIGTICSYNGSTEQPMINTTPESCEIHRLLADMVAQECDCCVMEVSSQGIALQRTADVSFDIGVFLNIEPDHIGKGEHATFSEYLYCKSRLMRQCGIGIVNQDDPNVNKILAGHTCEVETFAIRHPSDVMAEGEWYEMTEGSLQSHFTVKKEWQKIALTMQLPGQFNVYNALAAISVAGHFKVTWEQIKEALSKQVVPGRCQNMTSGADYVFLIDYAHNEMSLRNLLQTLKKFEPSRLIVIFGCGGNRSVLRRYQMGETAGRLADFTIITSDNPRWEDPERIMNQIEDGLLGTVREGKKPDYIKIADRRAAVEYAVGMAEKRDIIVLAGKGHESYQEIKGIRYPLDDRRIVQEVLDGGIRKYYC